ncbi:hypothetical protein QI334_03530 [Staphylococcus saprophyticus]|uniref:hypothetical protein n=1 Tax=Staphylococcus saprophyticus TaxID=29385 RepID=UPI00076AFD0A|nr:hypothetical protein [Staphylococcus saprophyticus]MDW3828436.1 hypothetical protein [Staphylococcus saprophyticus]MDW3914189.1 hypothetical protein [Staphylococcus saprophyticus]MDW3963727.1 hypothetical protein [Staphylococcus saprophyticus]MDW3965925.1 hypothetical protein [Staphylococcus saprophyticus]MDW3976002.1 hypothetical protein [Staphylococcus saprophyticus]
MKIKTKKQLNLPQLIEWAWNNDVKHRVFQSNPNFDGVTYKLGFDIGGDLYFEEPLTPTLLFTVEVEEEITEETKLDGLVELGNDGAGEDFFFSRGLSINDCKDEFTRAFYILNDDLTMTLIWRDGRLME